MLFAKIIASLRSLQRTNNAFVPFNLHTEVIQMCSCERRIEWINIARFKRVIVFKILAWALDFERKNLLSLRVSFIKPSSFNAIVFSVDSIQIHCYVTNNGNQIEYSTVFFLQLDKQKIFFFFVVVSSISSVNSIFLPYNRTLNSIWSKQCHRNGKKNAFIFLDFK